mmetsp:Transcript_14606/g.34144  ORF Transcript_14606/g.34144 Transcript_14606/m.34144 type:complete len:276 (-) Transcript_14606:177-1004(-)
MVAVSATKTTLSLRAVAPTDTRTASRTKVDLPTPARPTARSAPPCPENTSRSPKPTITSSSDLRPTTAPVGPKSVTDVCMSLALRANASQTGWYESAPVLSDACREKARRGGSIWHVWASTRRGSPLRTRPAACMSRIALLTVLPTTTCSLRFVSKVTDAARTRPVATPAETPWVNRATSWAHTRRPYPTGSDEPVAGPGTSPKFATTSVAPLVSIQMCESAPPNSRRAGSTTEVRAALMPRVGAQEPGVRKSRSGPSRKTAIEAARSFCWPSAA